MCPDFKKLYYEARNEKFEILEELKSIRQDSHECRWNPREPHCLYCKHKKGDGTCIFSKSFCEKEEEEKEERELDRRFWKWKNSDLKMAKEVDEVVERIKKEKEERRLKEK